MRIAVILLLLILCPLTGLADGLLDSDNDNLSDQVEIQIYYTNPNNPDSDGDGFLDGAEIVAHYSPHQAGKTLSQTDLDGDGLSDWQELQFHTDLNNPDSDGDGWNDFEEIRNGYNPLNIKPEKLTKKIVIDLSDQVLTAYLQGIPLAAWPVSTGKKGYGTPVGSFAVNSKTERAWSRTYGLWMPYWMSFIGSAYGIHELPEWPDGSKEGANHLGVPVSHGCVRLGVGPAAWLYAWAPIGTPVEVRN